MSMCLIQEGKIILYYKYCQNRLSICMGSLPKTNNGSLPNLTLKPQSWTKVSSIIFGDLPAGTGFSYPKTERAVQQSSSKLVRHAHQFIRKRSEEGLCDLLHNLHFELHHQAFSSIQSPDVGPHFGRYCHFTSVFII